MKKKICGGVITLNCFIGIATVLMVCVTALQMFYLNRLTQLHPLLQTFEKHSSVQQDTSASLIRECLQQLRKMDIIDETGLYFITPNIVKPVYDEKTENQTGITLCLHSTSNHLHYLPDLAKQWNGSVSLTVFTYEPHILSALKSIINFHQCYEQVKKLVNFHIVFPVRKSRLNFEDVGLESTCLTSDYSLNDDMNYNKDVAYPSNTLRNIAIRYASLPYILVSDIDFVPSKDLPHNFQYFLNRQQKHIKTSNANSKRAFVLPSFESKSVSIGSLNKENLKQLVKEGSIRQFYVKLCSDCQGDLDYDKWLAFPTYDFLEIAYPVDWERPWEPFYIAERDSIPPFDSRFVQYGFNRISQVQ